MNVDSWLLWGLVATAVLTTVQGISQGLRLTRMSFPLIVGTMFTADRDKAKMYGALVHFVNGWIISLGYVLIMESLGRNGWWIGALIGLLHAMFLLVVVLPITPSFHPRMASEQHGSTATRFFEPPGFMGLNYGPQTPIATVITHVLFGMVLGAFYHLRP